MIRHQPTINIRDRSAEKQHIRASSRSVRRGDFPCLRPDCRIRKPLRDVSKGVHRVVDDRLPRDVKLPAALVDPAMVVIVRHGSDQVFALLAHPVKPRVVALDLVQLALVEVRHTPGCTVRPPIRDVHLVTRQNVTLQNEPEQVGEIRCRDCFLKFGSVCSWRIARSVFQQAHRRSHSRRCWASVDLPIGSPALYQFHEVRHCYCSLAASMAASVCES